MSSTVIIIDDHPIFRDALVQLLRATDSHLCTRAVASVEEGLLQASRGAEPAAILLDLNLPGLDGVEAIAALRRKLPRTPVVVVSSSESRQEVMATFKAGAAAFVSKTVAASDICDLLRRVLSGSVPTPEWITVSGRAAFDAAHLPHISPRQQECLSLMSRGLSNKEIGRHLGIAEITVKNHISALFGLLNVVNRTQAVVAGRRLGLIAPPDDQ